MQKSYTFLIHSINPMVMYMYLTLSSPPETNFLTAFPSLEALRNQQISKSGRQSIKQPSKQASMRSINQSVF